MNEKRICYNCFKELNTENGTCSHCGYSPSQDRDKFPLALPHGSVLNGRYILGRVLGQGGFGITYIAQDWKEKKLVAIKEYFPDTMATRTGKTSIMVYTGQRGESFGYGKDCFLQEARTLADFNDNPNIVHVHCYFEENGTAYFVMDYIEGTSFQNYLKNHSGRIGWQEAVKLLVPVMRALQQVHSKGIIHRDVTPDNIFITSDGTVKLLDFGAARYSLGDKSRSLDVVLKHGFAPKEQYTRHGRQGPYTDIYSVGATLYYSITGRKPPDSIDRLEEDEIILPSNLGISIPDYIENAILKAMAIQPMDRFSSMAEFVEALDYRDNAAAEPIYRASTETKSNIDNRTGLDSNSNSESIPISESKSISESKADSESNWISGDNPDLESDPKKKDTTTKNNKKPIIIVIAVACAVLIISIVSVVAISRKGDDNKSPVSNSGGGTTSGNKSPAKEQYCVVPETIGLEGDKALSLLEDNGLNVVVNEEYSDDIAKGIVLAQSINAGMTVTLESEIIITVSKGIEQVKVPKLVGLSEKDAKNKLTEYKLAIGKITYEYDNSAKGTVIKQKTKENTTVDKGSKVSIVVSKGKKPEKKDSGANNNSGKGTSDKKSNNNKNNDTKKDDSKKKDDPVDLNDDDTVDLN